MFRFAAPALRRPARSPSTIASTPSVLYTIQREFSRLGKLIDGAHVVLAGDLKYGRTVHSLLKLLAIYRGLKITLVSPRSLEMPVEIAEMASRCGHVVEQQNVLRTWVLGADVLYATRIQKERFTDESIDGYDQSFEVNRSIVDATGKPDTVVMHPLPRDGRPGSFDLSVDLDSDPRLAIFRQTDNGIPIRMALFAQMLGCSVSTDWCKGRCVTQRGGHLLLSDLTMRF